MNPTTLTRPAGALVGFALFFCATIAGCAGEEGPPIASVSGTVTYDGEPVAEGSVNFFSSELGFGASADLAADGSYTLRSQYGKGIPLGEYQVSISPPPPEGEPSMDADAAAPEPKEYPNIPEKYRDPSTSGLTAEVTEGANRIDFEMQPQ